MKSGSSITLSKAWWKKEAPEGLKKSGAAFEKALDDIAKAEAGLGKGRPDAAAKLVESALASLAQAAKAVAAEAKDLEKKEKDKKRKADLSNTQSVMGKPLEKEMAALRAKLAALDDEAGGGDFADRDAHVAFLRKWAPKIKRGTVSFALGLPSNKPEEMRFNFHMSKDGRGLANVLKKEAGAKKFTFGRAGTEALAAEMGEEGEGARTLILEIEGRRIPGLAKRVKLMLKKLGISQFGRVRVLEGGVEADSADDDTPEDLALEEVDLDAAEPEDEAGETGGAETGGAETGGGAGERPERSPLEASAAAAGLSAEMPDEIDTAELHARYGAAFAAVKPMMAGMAPDALAELKGRLAAYGKAVKSGALADALGIVRELERLAGGGAGQPEQPAEAAGAAEPVRRDGGAEALRARRLGRLAAMEREIDALIEALA